MALVREYHDVIRGLVVGNEVLLRGEMTATDLRDLINEVKRQVDVPVTYADVWEYWLKNRDLAPAVDFVTIHILPYWEDFPVSASAAASHVTDIYRKVANSFPGKQIMLGEVGWPSEGRMREGALPSPSNQSRVLHDVVAAAKRGNWSINIIEAFDRPWKRQLEGTVGGHWGLLDADTRSPKFRWGRPLSDHPLWLHQGLIGILFGFVVFAAAYFSARSKGENVPETIAWFPVAGIALFGSLFLGWALAQAPLESFTAIDWARSIFLICIGFLTPPICAAAIARKTPMAGFSTVLDPLFWRAAEPLERILAGMLMLSSMAGMALALGLVFDPRYRDFHFAPLTGPGVALLIASEVSPAGLKRRGVAEWIAGSVLAASAASILVRPAGISFSCVLFLVGEASSQLGLVDLHDRRQLRHVGNRILDDPGVGDDRRLRDGDRQHLAGAVEDVAPFGRDRDGADALTEPQRHEVRLVAGLDVEEAHADGGERQHHHHQDGDEPQPDRRQRVGGRTRGTARGTGRAGCSRATGRTWRTGGGAARRGGARTGPRRLPLTSRLLGAKARLRFRPVGDRVGGRAVFGLGHRRTVDVQVLGRFGRHHQAEALGFQDDALRRRQQGRGEPVLLVGALLRRDLPIEPIEFQLVLARGPHGTRRRSRARTR